MLSGYIPLDQIKLALEKKLRYPIYKIEPFMSDVYKRCIADEGETQHFHWNFDDPSWNASAFTNSLKNPLYYGRIFVKIKDNNNNAQAEYHFQLFNHIVKSIASGLTYNYSVAAGIIIFDYHVETLPFQVNNPLPQDLKQDNITPFLDANLVFSDHLSIDIETGEPGIFSIDLHVFVEGYKIYFR